MRIYRIIIFVIAWYGIIFAGGSSLCAQDTSLLEDGSFEQLVSTGGGWPTQFAKWEGDYTRAVLSENGINAASGSKMLRFIYSADEAGSSGASQITQLIDVSEYSQLISQGRAKFVLTGFVNRVNRNSQTDTSFSFRIKTHKGLPAQFNGEIFNAPVSQNIGSLISDDDITTWEKITVQHIAPPETDFISIEIYARENVFNDHSGEEFHGHYADDMKLVVVPLETDPYRDLVTIPGGSVQIGDAIGDGYSHERPVHTSEISAFQIGRYEVTQGFWTEIRNWAAQNGYTDLPAGSTRDGSKGAFHPVLAVSWYDVVKWCNALSEKEGLSPCYYNGGQVYRAGSAPDATCDWEAEGYRLPTNAEWEKAARGGAVGLRFPWGNFISHSDANYGSNSSFEWDLTTTSQTHPLWSKGGLPYTSPVGAFSPNGYGLYDVTGNAWEWCWDRNSSYSTATQQNPRGSDTGDMRTWRGGSFWPDDANNSRVSVRHFHPPTHIARNFGFRLARGNSATAPEITGINPPNPEALDAKQTITINGTNFQPGCTVTLRDHRTGEIFPDRSIVRQTQNEIELSVNFTSAPSEWSVEVSNPSAGSSARLHFLVGKSFIPGQTLERIRIVSEAPSVLPASASKISLSGDGLLTLERGDRIQLKAIADFIDGTEIDITKYASWSVTGLEDTEIEGGSLYAELFAKLGQGTIRASYDGNGGRDSAFASVQIVTNFNVWPVWSPGTREGDLTRIDIEGASNSEGEVNYTWDLDEDGEGIFETSGASVTVSGNLGERHLLGLRGVDASGQVSTSYFYVTFQEGKAPGEVTLAHRPALGKFQGLDGNVLDLTSLSPINSGVVVIIHGLTNFEYGSDHSWMTEMATAISQRTSIEGFSPLVITYDWSEMADPSYFRDNGQDSASPNLHKILRDYLKIQPYGRAQGRILADFFAELQQLGLLDSTKPIHLIGHSAGGFVAGECASTLATKTENGAPIFSNLFATMLDTPVPVAAHFENRGTNLRLERYISNQYAGAPPHYPPSWMQHRRVSTSVLDGFLDASAVTSRVISYGAFESYYWGGSELLKERITQDEFYFRHLLPHLYTDHVAQHDYAHEWYLGTINGSANSKNPGFSRSPFTRTGSLQPTPAITNFTTMSAAGIPAASPSFSESSTQSQAIDLIEFVRSGSVTTSANGLTIAESAEAGITATALTVPVSAVGLEISYAWTSAGEGDYFGIYLNGSVRMIVPAPTSPGDSPESVSFQIHDLSMDTANLTIALHSVGEAAAELNIRQISWKIDDDVDGDGLSLDQENIIGTNPRLSDSDFDGLSDFVEAVELRTNPLNRDTDSDGFSDLAEVIANTDPIDPSSFLSLSISKNQEDSLLKLRWSSGPSRTLRLIRSDNLTRDRYWVDQTGLTAEQGSGGIEIPMSENSSSQFWWLEVEPF